MKIKKSALIILLCIIIAVLPGCKNIGSFSSGKNELKIGVEGLSGNYNPFYAESEADIEIISQMFRPIQIVGTENSLINHSGSISYEFIGDSQVKYTVSIDDGMRFSDGTHITIDDVIFFYHFIADATYDGRYKDWYLNNIEGLKEYYFDDKNYESSMAKLEQTVQEKYTASTISQEDLAEYLIETKIEGKYTSADSKSPSGQTWTEYVTALGYTREIRELGEKPTDEAWLKLVATAESQKNAAAYNPEEWYRKNLFENYLKSNYADGTDVSEISGIKKINDYTCSILFNSRNINAISEINTILIPRSAYSAEYIKGSAETVKELTFFAIGSGPYIIAENSAEEVKMSFNEFYSDDECEFRNLKFIDLAAKGYDPVESVVSGRVDVVNTVADNESVNALKDAPVQYFINNSDSYVSLFFNSRTLDLESRKALMGLCNPTETVDKLIGSYYSRILNPINIRFNEYPSEVTEPYYSEQTYSIYTQYAESPVKNATAYYCGSEEDIEHSVLVGYKDLLSKKGITLDIVIASEEELNEAIASGKADMWIDTVSDGITIDKYDYFNGSGALNKTGLNDPEINELTLSIRSAVGFNNKTFMISKLMKLVMQQAVEWPLYQRQEIVIYNTETISPDSFMQINESDGFTYFISKLVPQN